MKLFKRVRTRVTLGEGDSHHSDVLEEGSCAVRRSRSMATANLRACRSFIERCVDPTKIYRTHRTLECLVGTCCVFLRGVVGIIVTGRGIVPLELFTNRARHASPLHRFIEPTAPGMLRRRPLRFSAGRRRHHRDGSRNCSVGAVCKPGEECLAPTQIYRTHRAWDASSAPVAFFCGTSSASS